MLAIICVSTLLCIVLGVKNVVWSRGKPWGVYGRLFLLRFSNQTTTAYIFMYAFHKQLFNHDHVNSFSSKENKKKTIKKLVKHLKF